MLELRAFCVIKSRIWNMMKRVYEVDDSKAINIPVMIYIENVVIMMEKFYEARQLQLDFIVALKYLHKQQVGLKEKRVVLKIFPIVSCHY